MNRMEKPPVLSDKGIAQRDADFKWYVEQLKKMGIETYDNGLHIDHWIPADQWEALKEEAE